MTEHKSFKIAAVQAAPVFMDLGATIDKARELIEEAAGQGADLIVFPEAFLPGFPVWVWFIPPGHTHPIRELYSVLHANSVSVSSPAVLTLCREAARHGVTVCIGVNEKNDEGSDSTLYNTIFYIGPDGTILGKHRKLVPTSGERLVWGQGDGSDLEVFDLPFAKIGGLICWENYMPLARYALYAWGEQVHIASTWDHGEPWLSTMRHIAKEGRNFVVGCCQAFRKDQIPDSFAFKKQYLAGVGEWINPGDSVIVDPDGKVLAGPAEGETILYADVTADQLIGPRWQLDVVGHYGRSDIFELKVHRRPAAPIQVIEDPEPGDGPDA
jgi:nitrilase